MSRVVTTQTVLYQSNHDFMLTFFSSKGKVVQVPHSLFFPVAPEKTTNYRTTNTHCKSNE